MKISSLIFVIIIFLDFASLRAQDKAKKVSDRLLYNLVAVDGYESGWGFVIGKKKNNLYILTPNHVARNNDEDILEKSKLQVRFPNEGVPTQAYYTDYFVSNKRQDLAVLRVVLPPTYRYQPGVFTCTKRNPVGTNVWYIGKDGDWQICDSPGVITSYSNKEYSLRIEGLDTATAPGASGAPIISDLGFEGMLIGPTDDKQAIKALSLDFIEAQFREWGYPCDASKLKRSTYLYGALSLASVGSALLFKQKKDDKYNIYSTYLDPTAPIYQGTSRDKVYKEVKKFKTLETSSYVMAGVFAGLAYLVNKKCWFVSNKNKKNTAEFSMNAIPVRSNDLTSVQLQLNLKY